MPSSAASVESPWQLAPLTGRGGRGRLLFGRMFEDWTLETSLLRQRRRVVCIASGGCMAIALANDGHEVTAVDVNPAQVRHVRARLDGSAVERDASSRVLSVGRLLLRAAGVSWSDVERFLNCASPPEQVRQWDAALARSVKWALRFALHPAVLRMAYAKPFVAALPDRFDLVLAARLRRGLALHPNRTNPFAWQLLTGRRPSHLDLVPEAASAIELVGAEVADYLDRQPPGSVEAFSLSNILDGCDSAYRARLAAAVQRTAAPGALAITRSFQSWPAGCNWAARDRGLLWGAVLVEQLGSAIGAEQTRGILGGTLLAPPREFMHVDLA